MLAAAPAQTNKTPRGREGGSGEKAGATDPTQSRRRGAASTRTSLGGCGAELAEPSAARKKKRLTLQLRPDVATTEARGRIIRERKQRQRRAPEREEVATKMRQAAVEEERGHQPPPLTVRDESRVLRAERGELRVGKLRDAYPGGESRRPEHAGQGRPRRGKVWGGTDRKRGSADSGAPLPAPQTAWARSSAAPPCHRKGPM